MAARIAVLVLAHRIAPLEFLLRTLGDRFRVFLHLDAKTDAAGWRPPPHVRVIEPRRAVFWGGWSMMQATIDLTAAAQDCDRLVLVSGDALPLLAPEALHAALAAPGPERIELIDVPDDPGLAGLPREAAIARHGWEQPWRFQNFVHWDDLLLNPFGRAGTVARYGLAEGTADWLRGDAQRLVEEVLAALPPRPRRFARFAYGAQWWALSGDIVAGLLPLLRSPELQRWFRFLPVPDEHMIHTLLANATPPPVAAGSPMAVAAGSFDEAFLVGAREAGRLFARKFNPVAAPDLADAIAAGRFPPA